MYSLHIEPYKTDRSDFRITVNRAGAKLVAKALYQLDTNREENAVTSDLAYTIDSALERWK